MTLMPEPSVASMSALDLVTLAVRRADDAEHRAWTSEQEMQRLSQWQRESDLKAELLRIERADLQRRIRTAKAMLVAIEAAAEPDDAAETRLARKVLEGYQIIGGEAVLPPMTQAGDSSQAGEPNAAASIASYTPFEDCPHMWCVGCGTCHTCEAEHPPKLAWPTRQSALKGGPIPRRAAGEQRG